MNARGGGAPTARIAAALLAALLAGAAAAQSSAPLARPPLAERLGEAWRWRQIEGPEGETNAFVAVRPGLDGALLAAQDDGLLSFDGYDWRQPPSWTPLVVSEPRFIGYARRRLVMSSSDAVRVIDDDERRVIARTGSRQEMPRPWVLDDGRLLLLVDGFLTAVDPTGLERDERRVEAPVADRLAALAVDTDGRLWCSTEQGLLRHGERGWEPMTPAIDGYPPAALLQRVLRAERALYFLPNEIDDGTPAWRWDGRQLHPIRDERGPLVVTDACVGEGGELVIANRTPMLRIFDAGLWADSEPGLPVLENLQSVACTTAGRIALVSGSGRLWVCDVRSRRWQRHDPSALGVGGVVNALAPSRRGGLWLGTNRGICRWDGRGFTDIHEEAGDTGVPLRRLTALAEDEQGRLWVGSGSMFHGALRLDGERWSHHLTALTGDTPRFVHAIRALPGELWFTLLGDYGPGWLHGGFVRLRDGTFRRWDEADGAPLPRSYEILRTPEGDLLGGTAGGVFRLAGEEFTRVNELVLPAGRSAFALQIDRTGALWAGLGLNPGPLVRLADGTSTTLGTGTWRRAAAASFATTRDGRTWFASSSGLFLIDGEVCHEISGRLPVRNFWPILADDEGLWLGTLGSGLVRYQPDDDEPPRAWDTSIRFTESGLALATWEAADAWNTTVPEQLHFEVTLDGAPLASLARVGPGSTRTREVVLGDLAPGPHELRVVVKDSLGNRAPAPLIKGFEVPPPLWRSPLMLASLAATLTALTWTLVVLLRRSRERRLAREAVAQLAARLKLLTRQLLSSQEDERRRLSREMHDDLGQLLTAIGLDLQRAGSTRDEGHRRQAIEQALSTTRSVIDRVREISAMLRPALLDDLGLEEAAANAIRDFTARTGTDVQAELDLRGARLPEEVAATLFRILQEALTNVARHARAETVYVTLGVQGERARLEVRDDGRGFDREAAGRRRSYGLLGMRERAELIDGEFELVTAPGQGTRVSVSIPVRPPAAAPDPT